MSPLSFIRRAGIATVLYAAASMCTPFSSVRAQAATKPFAAFSTSAQTLRDSVVQMAKAQVGTRYRMGGESPDKGFDCSGLVAYVMSALRLDVPRTARLQAKEGLAVTKDTSRLLPGDLLTFGKSKKAVSHVGIYIGDGKYIHASSTAGRVIESKIDRPASPLIKMWRGARRVLSFEDSSAVVLTSPASRGGD
jgi:cell wall-associated NlpC family hydrolase